jgi:hypothetical protein
MAKTVGMFVRTSIFSVFASEDIVPIWYELVFDLVLTGI